MIEACKVNGVEPYRYLVTLRSALRLATIDDEALASWRLDLA
jgi:hypothetical protein